MKVVAGFFVAIGLFAMVKGWDDCNKRGGAYVPGVLWYQCVNKR